MRTLLLFFALTLLSFSASSQRDRIEVFFTSHYSYNPTFGQSTTGATGLRASIGGIWHSRSSNGFVDAIMFEIGYQRVGGYGFYQEDSPNKFIDHVLLFGTIGYGVDIGEKISFIPAITLGEPERSLNKDKDRRRNHTEVGVTTIYRPFYLWGFEIGIRGDLYYQLSGDFSVHTTPIRNSPYRLSGGVFASYTF
jgi:hypothetical protein